MLTEKEIEESRELVNGKNSISGTSLNREQLLSLRTRQLQEQEAQTEQLRLSYLAAQAATAALRAALENS